MFDNVYFLIMLASIIFFLAILVGAIVTAFLDSRLLRLITTTIMTALFTLLILWTNVRISGNVVWFRDQTGASSTNSPVNDIGDS